MDMRKRRNSPPKIEGIKELPGAQYIDKMIGDGGGFARKRRAAP
jgi:hypothetical protein